MNAARAMRPRSFSFQQPTPDHHAIPMEELTVDLLIVAVIVLLILWGAGLAFAIGGGLIHVLLVIALIIIVIRFIQGRRVP
jgi:hypothetical protein